MSAKTPKGISMRSSPADEYQDRVYVAKSELNALWALFRFGRGKYWSLTWSFFLIAASSVMVMVSSRFLGTMVDQLVNPKAGQYWQVYGGWFLGLEIFSVITVFFGRLHLAYLTNKIALLIRVELFEKMTRLPITYFDKQPLGRTITRLTSDVEGVENFFSGTLARIITSGIQIIAVLTAMLLTDAHFGLIIVASSVPSLIVSFILRSPTRYWLREMRRRAAHVNAKLAEFINGISVIKIFDLEDWSHERFKETVDDHFQASLKMMHWNSVVRPLTVLLCAFPVLIILWIGGGRVMEGTMALGLLVTFVRYSERFLSPVRTISQEIMVVQEALTSSERIRQMVHEPDEDKTLGPDGAHSGDLTGHVVFDKVYMQYEPTKPVLQGISFEALPGTTIGLVGETGSGKTTTINLIPRLYEFNSGNIFVDGISLRDWKRSSLRLQLGYVSQDVVIFRGTLRENLVGVTTISTETLDRRIKNACEKTGLAQVMNNFSNGLDSPLLEGGVNLSVGEKQLIAFTRMMLKDPKILILDEATANIDQKYETLVQQALKELLPGRLCFIVAHRLSTVVQCSKIFVFNKGKIIEEGTHPELISRGGYYSGLVSKQLQ